MSAGAPNAVGEHPGADRVFRTGRASVVIAGAAVLTGLVAANSTLAWLVSLLLPVAAVAGAVLGIAAWRAGSRARREIRGGAPFAWGGRLRTGYILGIVGALTSVVGALLVIGALVLILAFWANFS